MQAHAGHPATDERIEQPVLPGWREGLREAWQLAAPFWRDRAERVARAQFAIVLALTLASVGITVRLSVWNNDFYDALQAHDLHGFWHQIAIFLGLAIAFIVVAVYRMVVQYRLMMRWRTWLTHALLDRWLRRGTAYRLQLAADAAAPGQPHASPDNPDQRVAEDARAFVDKTLDLVLGLVNAGVSLVSFVGILWRLSGALHVPWPGAGWVLPGYMVWVALAYSLAGSWGAQRIGAPLIGTNARQQQVEADFRYQLVQVRDHAEAIALADGEGAERVRLAHRFAAIRSNWDRLIRNTKRLTWFSAGYGQLADVFPLLAAAPRYFSGALQLGGLMQTGQAFGQVQSALGWFVGAYGDLADWRATVWRLSSFNTALDAEHAAARSSALAQRVDPGEPLMLARIAVQRPDGQPLLQVPLATLKPGGRLLISGPSGSGKSSLLRTLAGLWPLAGGVARVPAGAMFVAQRPYLPDGTLAEALAYPHARADQSDAALREALALAGLEAYAGRLDEPVRWARVLSPGEQQRLQFARVFLQRPAWLFLDEATSALDEPTELGLYRQLRRSLPNAAIVSIGHRAALRGEHEHELRVQDGVLRRAPDAALLQVS